MTRSRITYDSNLIKTISLFESITGASAKDCFESSGTVHFVVGGEDMGRAIGKSGSNIRRIESLLKKKVKVVEFNADLATFIKNLVYPLSINSVDVSDGKAIIRASETKTKAMIIGRDSRNLLAYKEIVQRYFDVSELKVQ